MRLEKPRLITAVDTAFNSKVNRLYAAAVTLTYPDMKNHERAVAQCEADFQYIPALLAFREGPVILKALSRLQTKPDVIIYPGHGLAHPRGLGLASHLGLITDIPSIGCARRCLVGDYRTPPQEKGGCTSLFVSDVEAGFVYRTKSNVKPMFISPGHKCTIRDALDIIVGCLTEYRMPEPLRLAHLFANKYKQSAEKKMGQNNAMAGKNAG
ncbi:MAG: endonuclease V [candidate division Zixibacteria bacterium HGW-Zixibacteria-1]|nr:MAG: endonuclease V [candidate division Zixibacteria bacterium HGW-Zixibacteria-1]